MIVSSKVNLIINVGIGGWFMVSNQSRIYRKNIANIGNINDNPKNIWLYSPQRMNNSK